MAFYYKFGNEPLSLDEVAAGVRDSLLMQGVPVVSLPFSTRKDALRDYTVVGMTEYEDRKYDILVDHSLITSEMFPGTPLFDRLSTRKLDGNIKLSQRGVDFGNSIPPIAEFHFEPTQERINFIRRTAQELRRRLPSLAIVGLGYHPERRLDYSFELA